MRLADEDSPATAPRSSSEPDRASRAKLVMDAVLAAAGSANPVVEVIVPSVVGKGWTGVIPLTVEIKAERLPGGMLTAFPTYPTSDGRVSVGPPLLLDPAEPQAGVALATDIERLSDAIGGDPVAWQVRAAASGGSPEVPADEPWLERPSHNAVLERLRAVRTGRGGEVSLAVVEAPRWVVRLSVGGRPRDLRVRGRLIDRLDRRKDLTGYDADPPPRWLGRWRLRGEFPDPSPMLKEITGAILAQAPEAAEVGHPTNAVRLELQASASSAAESPLGLAGAAWVVCFSLSWALWFVVGPTTGFFGFFADLFGRLVVMPFMTLLGTIPAWAAGEVALGIADRWRVRWSAKLWLRRAATAGTYAAWFAAISLLPNWGLVLALTVCGPIGVAVVTGLRSRRAGTATPSSRT